MLTTRMQIAVETIQSLPQDVQDVIASWILEGLSEKQWTETFVTSERLLAELADEALEELYAGKTEPLTPDLL